MPQADSPHDGMIIFVYRKILHRDPTLSETAAWVGEMERGLSFDGLVSLVSASDEAVGLEEAELDASLSAVANLFSIALDRKPTLEDVTGWIGQLKSGRSVASFIDEILDSPEARRRYGLPQHEMERNAITFVYRHALGREPTEEDIRLWAKAFHEGMPFPAFLREVQTSEEGRRRAGALGAQSDADLIAFVYRHSVGRAPTEADVEEWSEHLRHGLSFQDFLRLMLNSEEARSAVIEQEPPSAEAIAFVYHHALYREPSEADIEAWSSRFAEGLPFQRFLLDVLTSDEALVRARQMVEAPDENVIVFVYRHALKREPTESDIALWAGHLRNGLSFPRFVALLVGSDEALARSTSNAEDSFNEAVAFTYRHALGREPTADDTALWLDHFRSGLSFPRFLAIVLGSDEARARVSVDTMSDALFVAHLFEICLGRCAVPAEIEEWKRRFVEHRYSKADIAMSFIAAAIRDSEGQGSGGPSQDGGSVAILGTNRSFDAGIWHARTAEIEAGLNLLPPEPLSAPYVVRPNTIRVSAIASLYKGGPYIRKFLDNITRQTLGENFELIIIDANSPDGEDEVIEQYRKAFPNIRYERMNYRIGIYDAWNVGVGLARGDYLTNTNLDDLRRRDSLEVQAAALDAVPFADVVYQDFFYTLDPNLTFEQIEAYGFRSALPLVTPNNLLACNSPHNAPMWRKRLHSELGLFDTSFKSAGDHDFWLRCLQAGKVFYKINAPHVVYYQNPDGLSTRPGSAGIVEGRRIQRRYGRKLISPDLYLDRDSLEAKLRSVSGGLTAPDDGGPTYERIQRLILSLADTLEPRPNPDLVS